MVGWHHSLDGHEFEQGPGDGEEQESLVCCSPWGHKESDVTEQPNTTVKDLDLFLGSLICFIDLCVCFCTKIMLF